MSEVAQFSMSLDIAHGEHLTSRCQGWTDDMTRQQGWAPEVA
jgi:hypothetical protein